MNEGYLHLTWAGYGNDDIFNQAKANIQEEYNRKLNQVKKNQFYQHNFKEIEAIYRSSAQGMQDFTKEQFEIEGYAEDLKNIDNAVKQLGIKKGKMKDHEKYINIFNSILPVLDKITKKYTGTGGDINDLAKLNNYISQLKKLASAAEMGNIKEIDKNFITKLRNYLQTSVSGVAFEIFLTAAFIDANIKALESINLNNQQLEKIIHAGNKSGVQGICSLDPQIAKDYEKGKFTEELINKEPGVDVILKYNMNEGGTLTTKFEGLQLKNYGDISMIPFGGRANLFLRQLNISNLFDGTDNLVNAAAAFGKNITSKNYSSYLLKIVQDQNSNKTQGNLNNEWVDTMSKMRQLASLDTLVSNKLSYLNQATYFVVRDKKTKDIKIITKYDIMNAIEKALTYEEHNKTKEVVWRYAYTDVHKDYFTDTKANNEIDSKTRSTKAYSVILNKINNTKITVAFNAANLQL